MTTTLESLQQAIAQFRQTATVDELKQLKELLEDEALEAEMEIENEEWSIIGKIRNKEGQDEEFSLFDWSYVTPTGLGLISVYEGDVTKVFSCSDRRNEDAELVLLKEGKLTEKKAKTLIEKELGDGGKWKKIEAL